MTVADSVSVEAVVEQETASSRAHKTLTSPVASILAIGIAVLWTIPPEDDVKSNGWWNALAFWNADFTLDNYKTVLHGTDTDLATYFVNTIVITIPSVLMPISIAVIAA